MANQAAYLTSIKAPLEVKPAPFTPPGPLEVLIRNSAVSINPIDIVQQNYGTTVQTYPHIPGIDIAGVIEEVGEGITRFQKGDRVAALAVTTRTQNLANAGFQLYTVAPEFVVSHIPSNMSFAAASVLPLGLSTAASGLYEPGHLGLEAPSAKQNVAGSAEKNAILIWGGSSTVGGFAIQLCVAAGLTVLTTASPRNHEYVKDLGAHFVFDHAEDDVVKKLIDAASGRSIVGVYDAISTKDTALKCAEFLHAFGGGTLFATRVDEFGPEKVLSGDVRRIAGHIPVRPADGARPVWAKVWADFIEEGLTNGKLRAKPDPIVIQGGLGKVQDAFDLYRKGVSAAKIVVEL